MKYKLKDLEVDILELDTIGDIMSVEEFVGNIIRHNFIDYDGFARFVITKGGKKYEIIDIGYSINNDYVCYYKDDAVCSLIEFCRYYEIEEVVWCNK